MRVWGDEWPDNLPRMDQPADCGDCTACGEPLVLGEAGLELPHVAPADDIPGAYAVSYRYQHRRCFWRSIFGTDAPP